MVSSINRNKVYSENYSTFVKNNVNSSINKLVEDCWLSPIQEILFDISFLCVGCLSLMNILIIQIVFKFYLKHNVKLDLSNILGVNINNYIENYINKIILLNKKMSSIYILIIFIAIITGLLFLTYGSYELFTNIDDYINVHNKFKNK
jgi:hypothetical protein